MRINLNAIRPLDDCGKPVHSSGPAQDVATIETFFDGHADRLASLIREADFVVGCMAWLTSRTVLEALADVHAGCQVVVQKEDFLRPGVVGREELRAMYRRLRCPDRWELPLHAGSLSYCSDPSSQAIRCMGIRAERPNQIVPRMHHKFFVFMRSTGIEPYAESDEHERPKYEPYAVWTGSYNATENASMSRENVAIIRSKAIAEQYANEWLDVFALSEPLDWTSNFVEPEWRFGS